VWLNADVLPGPGRRSCAWDADAFVRSCKTVRGAVPSLGWAVDVGLANCYTNGDVDAMVSLIRRHGLRAVVVAANLRIALRSPALDRLLAESDAELLLWTGTGEPAVAPAALDAAARRFGAGRCAFDALLAPTNAAGRLNGAALGVWGAWRRVKAMAPAREGPEGRPRERTCCAAPRGEA